VKFQVKRAHASRSSALATTSFHRVVMSLTTDAMCWDPAAADCDRTPAECVNFSTSEQRGNSWRVNAYKARRQQCTVIVPCTYGRPTG